MALLWVTTFIIIFVTSCIGLGYFGGFCVRRFRWPGWLLGVWVCGFAFLWPVTVMIYVWFDAQRYLRQHPHDDAPGLVVISVFNVVAPILFIASFLPLLTGVALGRRRTS
jgi:hypothetical protein